MGFPDTCLRGIRNDQDMEGSRPSSTLFHWNVREKKDDGTWALSINWSDDANAIDFTLNQEKTDGTPKFSIGVAGDSMMRRTPLSSSTDSGVLWRAGPVTAKLPGKPGPVRRTHERTDQTGLNPAAVAVRKASAFR